MQICEKIRLRRELKGWTQQEIACHLDMSPSGYGDIERGETDVTLSRLLLIAKVLEISLAELFDLNDKNIFQVGNHCTLENSSQINSCSPPSSAIQYELEKSRLLVEQKDKEIELLRQQNADCGFKKNYSAPIKKLARSGVQNVALYRQSYALDAWVLTL